MPWVVLGGGAGCGGSDERETWKVRKGYVTKAIISHVKKILECREPLGDLKGE